MSWEGKKFKLDKSENFDDYMKALGCNMILRKMGNTVTPTVDLKKDGDVYTFTTSSSFKTSTFSFKVGEEFDEETLDGRKVKTICTFDGENKLIQEQKGEKPSTIIREFTDSELNVSMTVGDIKSTRVYKAY